MRVPRRNRLPQRKLQLRMVAAFLGMSTVGLALQYTFSVYLLRSVPELPEAIGNSMLSGLLTAALVSAALALPLTAAIGVFVTFRVAGPAYGIEQYLRAFARGEDRGECRVRRDDELQSLAEAVNLALEHARQDSAVAEEQREDQPVLA